MARETSVNFSNQSAFPVKIEGRDATDWSFYLQPGESSSRQGKHRGGTPDISIELYTVIDGKEFSLDKLKFNNPSRGYNSITVSTCGVSRPVNYENYISRGRETNIMLSGKIEVQNYGDGLEFLKDDRFGALPRTGLQFYPNRSIYSQTSPYFDRITGQSIYLYEPVNPIWTSNGRHSSDPAIPREGIYEVRNYRNEGQAYKWDVIINYPSTEFGMPNPRDAILSEKDNDIVNNRSISDPEEFVPYLTEPGFDHPWAFNRNTPAPWNIVDDIFQDWY